MKFIYPIFFAAILCICSCGKGTTNKKNPLVDTTSIDTANIEQLEQELKDLEKQSSKLNEKIDSIDNLLND